MLLQRVFNHGIQLGTLFERAAARHPANIVILDHLLDVAPELGHRPTVLELAGLIDRIAARLWATSVRPGDHVVIYKTDGFDIPLLAFAANRIGAVPVLLSPHLDGPSAAELLRRAAPAHLLTDEITLERKLPAAVFEDASQVLLASGEHPDAVPLQPLTDAPRVRPVSVSPDAPALVTHTSGTTGLPKLAVHTGRTLLARYRPQKISAAMAFKKETVALHVSFVHSRMFSALAVTLLRGMPLIVLADDDPGRVADLFAQLRPGVIEAHPNSMMSWEELADDPRGPLAGVTCFSTTFDAIHPRTMHRLLAASQRRSPRFLQLYGQSETGPVVGRSYSRRWTGGDDGRCVGIPFPGMTRIRVLSRDGRPPSPSSPGHIEARSDGLVKTFLGEPERYRQQTHDGWWRMGDVGYRTRWGCLHLLDREVDIVPGLASTLVTEDTLLARLSDVTEVIVIPSDDGVPVPVVCVRDDRPLDQAAWRAAVAGLPPMADPVQRRLKDLPHTATTKIKRLELARSLRTASAVVTEED